MIFKAELFFDNDIIGRSNWYAVRYRRWPFMPWRNLRRPFIDDSAPTRSERNFPFLATFDEARKIAEQMATIPCAFEKWNAENDAMWARRVTKLGPTPVAVFRSPW